VLRNYSGVPYNFKFNLKIYRFLKSRKLTDDSDVIANERNLIIEINIKQLASISDKSLNLKVKRKYVDNYLCFGFTWNGNIDCSLLICISSIELFLIDGANTYFNHPTIPT
jgi:hypothetical protein